MSTSAHMPASLFAFNTAMSPAKEDRRLEHALESPVSEDDARDIRAVLAGEEAAFRRIVERYEHDIYRQMWRFTRDRLMLDELVQEAFVQVFYSLPRFRGDAPLLHWIRRISTRVGYQYWKKSRKQRENQERLAQCVRECPAPRDQSPEEAGELLHRLLATLPPKDRLVLTLYYLEDCSAADIAARMGWNATLVRVRVHRAIRSIRKHLEAAGLGGSRHD